MNTKSKFLEECMIEGIDIDELLIRLSNFSIENNIINFSAEHLLIDEINFSDFQEENYRFNGNKKKFWRFYIKFREK